MRKILILCCMLFISACSSTLQTASISKAYKTYKTNQFEQTLKHISTAENSRKATSEQKAEFTYLNAQAYEGLGKNKIAVTLYEYLKEQHTSSQYGYLASKKLEQKR
jgi:ABC-type oligopeptide transport system substrate-binding subunit